MEVWIWIGAIGSVIGAIIVYVALMIFFPEWVGIMGKNARKNESQHNSEESKVDDFLNRLQGGSSKKPKS